MLLPAAERGQEGTAIWNHTDTFLPSFRMNDKVRAHFVGLGSSHVNKLGFRDNWVFLGAKGLNNKSPFEEVHGPALPPAPEAPSLSIAPPEPHLTCLSAEIMGQQRYPPTSSQAASFATLQTCTVPPTSSFIYIFFLFSCSTSKIIREQINTRAGLRCWRWKAVSPGRWINIKSQSAMKARPVSQGPQPHRRDPSPTAPPGHTAQQQLFAPGTSRVTAGAAQGLEKGCTSTRRARANTWPGFSRVVLIYGSNLGYFFCLQTKNFVGGFSDFLNKISIIRHYLLASIFKHNPGFSWTLPCPLPPARYHHHHSTAHSCSPPHMAQGKVIPGDAQTLVGSPWISCHPRTHCLLQPQ